MYNFILDLELSILSFISHIHNEFLDTVMLLVTKLGDKGFVWILISLILLAFKKTRKLGICVSLALILNLLLVNVITKPLVARIRPYEVDKLIKLMIPPPSDYSFPSGHTSAAFSFSFAFYKMSKKFSVPFLVLASLMAFSRLYFSVHFPTDVIGGIAFGFIASYLAKFICDKYIYKKETNI